MSDTPATLKERLSLAFRWLSIAATAATLWWFLRRLNVSELGAAAGRADLRLLVLAVVLNIGGQLIRAASWVVLLGPRYAVPFGRLVRYEFAAQAASSISPARAGEVLRPWLLKRENVPVAVTSALIVLKKALGAASLGMLTAAVIALLSALPGWVPSFVVLTAMAMAVLVMLLVLAAFRTDSSRMPRFLRGLADGMYVLRDPRRFPLSFGIILSGEAIDATAGFAVLRALHIGLSVAAAIFVLFFIDFSNALPAAPANLGTFEVGALYCLGLLHVPQEPALAFALLFHLQQTVPQIIIGLPFELHFLGTRKKETTAAAAGTTTIEVRAAPTMPEE
jgi:glycosyltransferase 2 family protein